MGTVHSVRCYDDEWRYRGSVLIAIQMSLPIFLSRAGKWKRSRRMVA